MTTTQHRRQVEQEVLAKLDECKKIAAAKGYPVDFTVEFLYRGSKGGHYRHSNKTIAINIALACLNEQNKQTILNDTCQHETCHAIEAQHFGFQRVNKNRIVHGWRFYHLGRVVFGLELTRCHDMKIEGVARTHARPFTYACRCQEHKITRNIHNKIQLGRAYLCNKCKTKITLVNKTKEVAVADFFKVNK